MVQNARVADNPKTWIQKSRKLSPGTNARFSLLPPTNRHHCRVQIAGLNLTIASQPNQAHSKREPLAFGVAERIS